MSKTRMLESGYSKPEYDGTKKYRLATLKDIEAGHEFPAYSVSGKVVRARRNGMIKRWKRSPERFSAPMKYGMYECFRADEDTQSEFAPGALLVEILSV